MKIIYMLGYLCGAAKRLSSSPFFQDLILFVILLVVCCVSFVSMKAEAEETAACEAVLGGWSYHADREANYNETHNTVGLECNDWVLMTYTNSMGNRSVFAGRSIESSDTGFSYGFQYGIINGYDGGSSKPFPIVLPKISYNTKWGGVDVISIPGVVSYANLKFHLTDYTPTKSEPTNYVIGIGYGTTGRTLSLSRFLTPTLDIELIGSSESLQLESTDMSNGVVTSYEVDADFLGVRANYYPWRNDFKVTVGLAQNNSIAKAEYSFAEWYRAPRQVRAVTDFDRNLKDKATIGTEFDDLAPYIGVGWGNPWIKNRKLSMSVDMGAYYIGGVQFEGSIDSPVLDALGLKAEGEALVAKQVAKMQEDYGDLKWWWNVSVNVRYRF